MEEVTAEEVKEIIEDAETQPTKNIQKDETVYCSVSKPEKVGDGMNAYVIYTVKTKGPDDSTMSTVRRYSDFDWLHDMLKYEFRSVIIPPLPEKVIFDRFSPETVEYRRKELERFLTRVLNHPILSGSNSLKIFFTATEVVMEEERTKPKPTVNQPAPPPKKETGFFASITASLSSVVTGPTVELKEIDPYFDTQKLYLTNLDQQLQVLVTRSNANTRKKQEMVSTLTDFAHAASLAAGCEVGQDDSLANFWEKLSEILNQMSQLTDELVRGETELFEDQVKDYVRLVGACKDLMENRNATLLELQQKQADATMKAEKMQKAQGTPKAPLFAADSQDANDASAQAEESFNSLTKSVKSELDVFKQNKGQDLRKAIRELVRLNINHQLRVVNLWKELLSELEETKI